MGLLPTSKLLSCGTINDCKKSLNTAFNHIDFPYQLIQVYFHNQFKNNYKCLRFFDFSTMSEISSYTIDGAPNKSDEMYIIIDQTNSRFFAPSQHFSPT